MKSAIALALTMSVATPDPIARSIQREAARLAAIPAQTDSDWSRVRALRPGTMIAVTVRNGSARTRRFASADDSQLMVDDGSSRDAIIARGDILEVALVTRRGSIPGAIGGAAIGALVGVGLAIALGTEVQCQPSCGGVQTLMVVSAVGIPVGGGFAGYHLFRRTQRTVIYRAP
jgi:hypothetical protein